MKFTFFKNTAEFIKDHIFIFISLLCSFFLALIPCLYCLITFYRWYCKLDGLKFLIPFFVMLLFTLIAKILHKKFPIIINISMFIINIFIICIIQVLVAFVLFDYYCSKNLETIGDETKYYKTILQNFPQDKTIHFPKKIPIEAKNVQLH